VADDLPLYDILNEFQKGHSHMAVVVKRTKEAGASTEKQKSTTADYKINPKDAHADGTCLLIFSSNFSAVIKLHSKNCVSVYAVLFH
jgi:metal transporter CNNM